MTGFEKLVEWDNNIYEGEVSYAEVMSKARSLLAEERATGTAGLVEELRELASLCCSDDGEAVWWQKRIY